MQRLRRVLAVYIAYEQGEVYYVGLSDHVHARLANHNKVDFRYHEIRIVPMSSREDAAWLEQRLIDVWQPPGNIRGARGTVRKKRSGRKKRSTRNEGPLLAPSMPSASEIEELHDRFVDDESSRQAVADVLRRADGRRS